MEVLLIEKRSLHFIPREQDLVITLSQGLRCANRRSGRSLLQALHERETLPCELNGQIIGHPIRVRQPQLGPGCSACVGNLIGKQMDWPGSSAPCLLTDANLRRALVFFGPSVITGSHRRLNCANVDPPVEHP